MIPINPTYKRLLDIVGKFIEEGSITLDEWYDLKHSRQYLINQEWKKAEIKNKSLIASMTDDVEWQHQLCAELDELERSES